MQRVYEIQSGWDQRRKLRNFALRPPMQPSLPYNSPVYNPNLFSLFSKPSPDKTKNMKTINNSGFSGYSFSQKRKNAEAEIDPVENLRQQDEKNQMAKKNLEDDIDKKIEAISKEKINSLTKFDNISKPITSHKFAEKKEKVIEDENIIMRNSKNFTEHTAEISKTNDNKENVPKISDVKDEGKIQNEKIVKNTEVNKNTQPELDYNSIAEVIGKIFEKLGKKMEKWMIIKVSKNRC